MVLMLFSQAFFNFRRDGRVSLSSHKVKWMSKRTDAMEFLLFKHNSLLNIKEYHVKNQHEKLNQTPYTLEILFLMKIQAHGEIYKIL